MMIIIVIVLIVISGILTVIARAEPGTTSRGISPRSMLIIIAIHIRYGQFSNFMFVFAAETLAI